MLTAVQLRRSAAVAVAVAAVLQPELSPVLLMWLT